MGEKEPPKAAAKAFVFGGKFPVNPRCGVISLTNGNPRSGLVGVRFGLFPAAPNNSLVCAFICIQYHLLLRSTLY